MGSYLRREDLDKSYIAIPIYATYYNQQIHTNSTGADINPVTLYVLRKYGICVYGKDVPFTYVSSINELLTYVLGNMNTYWLSWIKRLEANSATNSPSNPIAIEQVNEAVEWCIFRYAQAALHAARTRHHQQNWRWRIWSYDPPRTMAAVDQGSHCNQTPAALAISIRYPTTRLQDLVELLRYIHTACTSQLSTNQKSCPSTNSFQVVLGQEYSFLSLKGLIKASLICISIFLIKITSSCPI